MLNWSFFPLAQTLGQRPLDVSGLEVLMPSHCFHSVFSHEFRRAEKYACHHRTTKPSGWLWSAPQHIFLLSYLYILSNFQGICPGSKPRMRPNLSFENRGGWSVWKMPITSGKWSELSKQPTVIFTIPAKSLVTTIMTTSVLLTDP